jgi:hypothetical protein
VPDDKLQRVIQYAAALILKCRSSGIRKSPVKRAMTAMFDIAPLAAQALSFMAWRLTFRCDVSYEIFT